MKIELTSEFLKGVEGTTKLLTVLNSAVDQVVQQLEAADDIETLADPVRISMPEIKIKLKGFPDRKVTLSVNFEVIKREELT